MDKEKTQNRITEIETAMLQPDFWNDREVAQKMMQELQELKDELSGVGKYDRNSATITIFAGAGGDDAEDWVRILLDMYMKFSDRKGWQISFLDQNENTNGGYRSVTISVDGKNVFGTLQHESGVHRLVRKSPFNSAGKRQTSFAMVEVVPQFDTTQSEIVLSSDDLEIGFTRSSGPGGQNVNKRETAVRVTHVPTGVTSFVSTERSQAQNKERALDMVRGKIFTLLQKQQKKEIRDLTISKDTTAEWGSQIRSYVLHPYKMVKDHRNDVETSNVDDVLSGNIDLFIESMKQ